MKALFFIFFAGCWGLLQAQCPSANFSIPATVCLNGSIAPVNSASIGSYDWDYCSGDLNSIPTAQNAYTLSGAVGRPSIELVKDGSRWFGFVTGTFTNTLFRLEFDNGIGNAPTSIQNLGSLSGMLNQPGAIRIVKQNSNWFGLIHNSGNGELILLSFGNSLSNAFTTTVALTTMSLTNEGLAVGYDQANGWVCVLSIPGEQFQIIKLGNDLSSITASSIVTPAVTGSSLLLDVDLIRHCDQWYAFATNLGTGKIFRLSFGTNLFQQPVIDQVADVGGINGGRVRALKEGENYFLAFVSLQGPFYKIDLGNDPATLNPSVTNEGNFGGVLQNTFGIAVAKENSVWNISVVDQGSGKVNSVKYPNVCSVTVSNPGPMSPLISYTQAGSYQVSLTVTNASGITSTLTKTVNVSASTAPDIDFISVNNCVGSNVNFNESNISGNIILRAWDFDDSQSSNSLNPSHVYSAAGNYRPKLTVTASNTCTNFVFKTISVYNSPIADFNLPIAPLICTNQNYVFLNTATFDPGSNPSWEWRLNGSLVSMQKDFTTAFSSATPQDIRLRAIIPGCQNEQIKSIASVTTGPSVSFNALDNCQGTSVSFTNNSTGVDAGYVWDFGDATTSTQINPSHTYSLAGTFQVKVTASNSAGCQNFFTQPLIIYSKPIPDFSVGLPPFACSNTATPFQNNTPTLTDSNISTWSWQFGDPAAGTSSQQNPSYVYSSSANYNVALTALTDKGCSGTFTKSISIASSPIADFTVGPACLNLGTKFTDLSSGSVQTRAWQIASATFGIPSPTYTFTSPGNFLATLTVTGANLCSTFKTKTVNVPVPPVLDFAASNLCSGKATRFTDITLSPQDVIVGWNWNFAGNSTPGNPAENIFSTAGSQNIKMTTTHLSGCKYTLSKNVLINTSPVADFIAAPDRGSAPLIVQFINTSQLASSYVWKFYDRVLSTTTQTSPSHTFISLGNYSTELTATSAQGCVDVKTVPIIVLVPTIDLVLTDFALTPDPTTGKLKGVVTILNKSNIPLVSAEIGLILADKAVVNETFMINLNPGQSVSKTLSFTISPNQFEFNFLCAQINSEKDVDQSNNKRCINLEKVDYFFNPYPNPTAGLLHVDWISIVPEIAHIVIYDAMGRKNYEWETLSAVGLNRSDLDVTFLSSGLYFLSIETPGVKKTSRFFRQ